jgi:hypothetical protein
MDMSWIDAHGSYWFFVKAMQECRTWYSWNLIQYLLISFFPEFLVAHFERINHFLIEMPFDFAVFTVFMALCRLTTKDQKYT